MSSLSLVPESNAKTSIAKSNLRNIHTSSLQETNQVMYSVATVITEYL